MNVLIACEESQRVCIEFRNKRHNAFSCDIIECSGGHPEWHIHNDVLPLLNGNCKFKTQNGDLYYIDNWDMIIAFPPCTHLCGSGAAFFEKKRKDGRQEEAIEFFMSFILANCEKIVVENPVGIISGNYIPKHFPHLAEKYNLPIKPTQIIEPWFFGDNVTKKTCLWIKGLSPLKPYITNKPNIPKKVWVNKEGKTKSTDFFYMETLKLKPEERSKQRSKTFPGIAKAMAEQWG